MVFPGAKFKSRVNQCNLIDICQLKPLQLHLVEQRKSPSFGLPCSTATNALVCKWQLIFALVCVPTISHIVRNHHCTACSRFTSQAVCLHTSVPSPSLSPLRSRPLPTQISHLISSNTITFSVTTPWPRCLHINTLSLLLFPCNPLTKMKQDKKSCTAPELPGFYLFIPNPLC